MFAVCAWVCVVVVVHIVHKFMFTFFIPLIIMQKGEK